MVATAADWFSGISTAIAVVMALAFGLLEARSRHNDERRRDSDRVMDVARKVAVSRAEFNITALVSNPPRWEVSLYLHNLSDEPVSDVRVDAMIILYLEPDSELPTVATIGSAELQLLGPSVDPVFLPIVMRSPDDETRRSLPYGYGLHLNTINIDRLRGEANVEAFRFRDSSGRKWERPRGFKTPVLIQDIE
jgi:hypothetical protein